MRARLLPEDVIRADDTKEGLYLRKAKELLQSYKLTQAFPGEDGKKAIITAYLNEISYGTAYGIAAAADDLPRQGAQRTHRQRGRPAGSHPPGAAHPLPLGHRRQGSLHQRRQGALRQEGQGTPAGAHSRLVVRTCAPG